MADLAIAAVLGPAHRNTGRPRYADVVAHLYVGGSGLWQFHRLERHDAPASAPNVVRLRSVGETATELATGFALVTGFSSAVELVEKKVGHHWAGEDLELDESTLRELARQVTDLDVAVLATLLAPDPGMLDEFAQTSWSVVLATPVVDSRSTQWD